MEPELADFVDVRKRAEELGVEVPTGLALLPLNFATARSRDELLHADTVDTVRKMLREAGVEEISLESGGAPFGQERRKFAEVILPILFVSYSLISQNPYAIDIALNVISNYLTDFFRGLPGPHTGHLEIVLERTPEGGEYRRIDWRGPPESMNDLKEVIREAVQR